MRADLRGVKVQLLAREGTDKDLLAEPVTPLYLQSR